MLTPLRLFAPLIGGVNHFVRKSSRCFIHQPYCFVGSVNVSDDDLVFQNRSLSFLLTTSCNKQNISLVEKTILQIVINVIHTRRQTSVSCTTFCGNVSLTYKSGFPILTSNESKFLSKK